MNRIKRKREETKKKLKTNISILNGHSDMLKGNKMVANTHTAHTLTQTQIQIQPQTHITGNNK